MEILTGPIWEEEGVHRVRLSRKEARSLRTVMFREWRAEDPKRRTVKAIAEYLGVNPSAVRRWTSGRRAICNDSFRWLALAEEFGGPL